MRTCLAIALLGLAFPAFAADYFPPKGEAWATHTPAQEKLDPKKLQAAIDFAIASEQQYPPELAKVADVILVVGAKNSSNSNRLREIGIEEGVPSYLINDGSELKPEWVRGKGVVGLTAGASAPEELVRHVIEALSEIEMVEVEQMDGKKEHIEFRLPAELRA